VRAIAQAGLYPSNCRILDPQEAFNTGAADGSVAIMVLGFESGDHSPDAWMARALECCADHGGTPEAAKAGDAHLEGAAGIWRNAFIRMPYAREFLTPAGLINDTFETAITWDRFESFHDTVKAATERAILEATGVKGEVTCRFTHVYPDGPAPYFSFHALGRHGALLQQWQAIKNAASDALIEAGGTITHHHAVGRDHRPWYDRQRPELFAAALRAAKKRTRSARHAQSGSAHRSVRLIDSVVSCLPRGAELSRRQASPVRWPTPARRPPFFCTCDMWARWLRSLPDARSCLHFRGRYRTVSLPSLLGEFRQRFNPQLILRVPSPFAVLQKSLAA
jgi:hypothetical protein